MIQELATFTSTHLAMVTLLMPWKKIVMKSNDTAVLWTIWDMLNLDKWPYAEGKDDDSLLTMTKLFLSLTVVLLAMTILSFALVVVFPSLDPNVYSIVDFLTWGLVIGLLVCMITSQSDFDASWAYQYGNTYDTDKMFLPIGVLAVHLAMSSFFVGKDLWERMRS